MIILMHKKDMVFDGQLTADIDQDEVDKLIKQYKKIKKAAKSNLGQVRKSWISR